ncbi:hypothetical protein Mapa_000328 [Marchantia paleacea]|nr:hypothetical protein Mapa_000328 [Marchantia paleacea]
MTCAIIATWFQRGRTGWAASDKPEGSCLFSTALEELTSNGNFLSRNARDLHIQTENGGDTSIAIVVDEHRGDRSSGMIQVNLTSKRPLRLSVGRIFSWQFVMTYTYKPCTNGDQPMPQLASTLCFAVGSFSAFWCNVRKFQMRRTKSGKMSAVLFGSVHQNLPGLKI